MNDRNAPPEARRHELENGFQHAADMGAPVAEGKRGLAQPPGHAFAQDGVSVGGEGVAFAVEDEAG